MSTHMPRELESLLRVDGAGPATPIDGAARRALIEGALDRYGSESGLWAAPAAGQTVKTSRKLPLWWMLAAALVITGSAAAMVLVRQPQSAAPTPPRAPSPAPRLAAQPAAPSATPPRALEPPQAAEPAVVEVEQAKPAPRVQDLLRSANQMRGAGQYPAAERKYQQVVRQSPHSAAGYSARVAAASLRHERLGDPRGALKLYRQALRARPGGALTPEIHTGMADVYRKLGDPAGERRALQALLAVQPQGPAAERARARLQGLDAPTTH